MSGYNPWYDHSGALNPRYDFGRDLEFGVLGEDWVKSIWEDRWEVKTDRYRNGRMVVETEQNPHRRVNEWGQPVWVPSGVAVTRADWWVYVTAIGQSFVVVAVPRLRRFVWANQDGLSVVTFAKQSDNPARGYLLSPDHITSLMVDKKYDGD
jgi:hypothetical protein